MSIKSINALLYQSAIGNALNVAFQLLAVRILLSSWGTEQYSSWLLLSAVASVFSIVELGLPSATQNYVIMNHVYSQRCKFISNSYSAAIVLNLLIVIIYILSAYFPNNALDQIIGGTKLVKEQLYGFVIIIISNFIALYQTYINIGLSSLDQYRTVVLYTNLNRFIDIIIVLLTPVFDFTLEFFLGALLISRIVVVAFEVKALKIIGGTISASIKFDFKYLKKLVIPAAGYASFPVGFAFRNQLLLLSASSVLNPAQIVTYTISRTLVNFLYQVMNIFNNSVQVELTNKYRDSGYVDILNIQKKYGMLLNGIVIPLAVILYIYHVEIIAIWLGRSIHIEKTFLMLLLIDVLLHINWGFKTMIFTATNRTMLLSFLFALASITGYILFNFYTCKLGFNGIGITLLAVSIVMFLYSCYLVSNEAKTYENSNKLST